MSKEELTIYLNDHLAGSVGAMELVDHLIETYKGKSLEQFFKDLRSEIDEDQDTLQDLIEKLGKKESAVRKAGAWVAEKVSRAKIRLSDSEKGQMGLLHALEGLVLGITGKRGLWTALAAAAETVPQLREIGLRAAGKTCSGTMRPRRGETLRGRARGISFGLARRRQST